MITKLSHVSIYVLDHEDAKDFYVNKLGFQLRTDAKMDNGFRWLTVSPKDQPGLELVLLEMKAGDMWDEETADTMRKLVKNSKLGAGVFEASDCRAAYEELKSKGVEFISPPKEQFYGVEAIFKDNSGNWFSLTEAKKQ